MPAVIQCVQQYTQNVMFDSNTQHKICQMKCVETLLIKSSVKTPLVPQTDHQ